MSLDLKTDPAAPPATTPEYETLLDLVKFRMSVRNLKPDPIPDEYVTKVLEVARWAMSGANSQPWEFVVVKDAAKRRQLYDTYMNENMEFIYWMERQRALELRHPAFQVPGVSDPHNQASGSGVEPKRGVAHAPAHPALRLPGPLAGGTKRRLDHRLQVRAPARKRHFHNELLPYSIPSRCPSTFRASVPDNLRADSSAGGTIHLRPSVPPFVPLLRPSRRRHQGGEMEIGMG